MSETRKAGWYYAWLGNTQTADVVYTDESTEVFHAGSLGSVKGAVRKWGPRIPAPDEIAALYDLARVVDADRLDDLALRLSPDCSAPRPRSMELRELVKQIAEARRKVGVLDGGK